MDHRTIAVEFTDQTQIILKKLDQILDLLQAQAQPKAKPFKGVSAQTDDQWLDSLGAYEAYHHIKIREEYDRARIWCEANNRQCTRKFFVGWLNRVPKEIAVQAMTVKPTLPPVMTKVTPVRPPGEAPPKEVAEKLSRLLGREMSF